MSRDAKLPMYFAGFLQDVANKDELFNLLTEDVIKHEYPPSKHVYITSGSHVKSNRADISMSTNDHEEAASRMCYGSAMAHGSTSATTVNPVLQAAPLIEAAPRLLT